jgi:indolepyruvate ferredoxin oxidoreductase alpha subunit
MIRGDLWSASRLLAHQLVRAGYAFAASYPGSPTTLITDELAELGRRQLIRFRYAANEKIAFEMAAGAALSGARSAVVMKHVGLNVALDSAIAIAYTGHTGALLLIVGDDPPCESSSNQQDSRVLARLMDVPCLETASIHDLGHVLRLATALSEDTGGLVMLRLTTALCYSSAFVDEPRAEAPPPAPALALPRKQQRYVLVPTNARADRVHGLRRFEEARACGEQPSYLEERAGDGSPGPAFVVQRALAGPFERACARLGIDPPVWQSRMAWPISEGPLKAFLARHARVVVVEELETLLAEQTIVIAHRHDLGTRVEGDWFPPRAHLDEELIAEALARKLGRAHRPPLGTGASLPVVARPPTFCAGCPHTASFYSLKRVLDELPRRPFVSSDVGCYTLGAKPGLEVGDVMLSMGASLGVAAGTTLMGQETVALIGDSTFFHAGLPAFKDAIAQGLDLLVCVFDNGGAAMTGGPMTPTAEGLQRIALALGAAAVEVVDPFELDEMRASLLRLIGTRGVTMLIAKSPCALTVAAAPRRPRVDLEACTGCGSCVTEIHCPAIALDANKKFQVDTQLCVGCGLCAAICPERALTPEPFG